MNVPDRSPHLGRALFQDARWSRCVRSRV